MKQNEFSNELQKLHCGALKSTPQLHKSDNCLPHWQGHLICALSWHRRDMVGPSDQGGKLQALQVPTGRGILPSVEGEKERFMSQDRGAPRSWRQAPSQIVCPCHFSPHLICQCDQLWSLLFVISLIHLTYHSATAQVNHLIASII